MDGTEPEQYPALHRVVMESLYPFALGLKPPGIVSRAYAAAVQINTHLGRHVVGKP